MFGFTKVVESLTQRRWAALCIAFGAMASVALLDVAVRDVPLGILYIIPVMTASLVLPRTGIIALAIASALFREALGPDAWEQDAAASIALGLMVFVLSGLLVAELVRNHHMMAEHLKEIEIASRLQREAENESRQLVECSPGAILTIDASGQILMANEAARHLLGDTRDEVIGDHALRYLPTLAPLIASPEDAALVRSMVEGAGRRASGEEFFAQMWLSSYQTGNGPRIAVVFSDATEILRDREEIGLRQLLMSSRIVTAAVSHEVRNLSNSAYRLFRKIGDDAGLSNRGDYKALSSLLNGMKSLTSEELKPAIEDLRAGADLDQVLQELRLILEPSLRERGVRVEWTLAPRLPAVRADRTGLLQVLLNLAQNALRAVDGVENKRFSITTFQSGTNAVLRFTNNGNQIESPGRLFQPLQPNVTGNGLGLFISRAIVRSYGGEIKYATEGEGCTFVITLPLGPINLEDGYA